MNFSGFLASLSDPHGQGNFGPFQICYDYGISVCGGYPGGFQTRGKTKTPYDNDMTAFIYIERQYQFIYNVISTFQNSS